MPTDIKYPRIGVLWKGTQGHKERQQPKIFGHGDERPVVQLLGDDSNGRRGDHAAYFGWNGKQVRVNGAEPILRSR